MRPLLFGCFHLIILAAAMSWVCPAPVAAAPSLLADRALERDIMAMNRRYTYLEDEYRIFEELIKKDFNQQFVQDLEVQYKEIDFLLSMSAGHPFAYRNLYNEMFNLHMAVNDRLDQLNSVLKAVDTNKQLLGEAFRDYAGLPKESMSRSVLEASHDLRTKLAKLEKRMDQWAGFLTPLRQRLDDLNSRINADLEELQREIPIWLAYFMFNTDNHMFQAQPWLLMPVSWEAWKGSLGYTMAAKLPDSWLRFKSFLAVFFASGAFILAAGRWMWRKWAVKAGEPGSAVRRNFLHGGLAAGLALALFLASIMLEFPGRMCFHALWNLSAAYGAYHLAWALRGLSEGISKRPPLAPLFWLFTLVVVVEFLFIPLVSAMFIWPFAALVLARVCLKSSHDAAPALERRICRTTGVFCLFQVLLCAAGMIYMVLMLSRTWFVAAVALQLGVALARLVRRRMVARYADQGRFGLSIMAGLAVPVIWMALLFGVAYWTVEQFGEIELLARFIEFEKAVSLTATLLAVLFADRLLASFLAFYGTYPASRKRPIKGYVQVGRLFIYIVGVTVLACLLLNKSPWGILGGIGAMAAVLMFVFKDTIQSLVASIQIVADDLVRIGDWIEIRGQDVDGEVVDVTLHTIKVQNWDKTISTVPTYALSTKTFKNWRGMFESGGRRIKRRILLDQATIRFLDSGALDGLSRIDALKDYLAAAPSHPPATPESAMSEPSVLNHPQITNAGAFRAYLAAWLGSHPLINGDMTFLVRYLEPTVDGLPLEIYVFATDTNWTVFESILADVFEHAQASISLFDLRVTQRPAPAQAPNPALAKN